MPYEEAAELSLLNIMTNSGALKSTEIITINTLLLVWIFLFAC